MLGGRVCGQEERYMVVDNSITGILVGYTAIQRQKPVKRREYPANRNVPEIPSTSEGPKLFPNNLNATH
jgi:hypothetical protein